VATTVARVFPRSIHPLHAIFLAFPLPLFLGAFLSDLAYASTQHIQWLNFAAWLNAGGLLIGAFALVWALIEVARTRRSRNRRPLFYFGSLLAMWVLGLITAFVHGKDAWATMPEGLYLSAIVAVLAFAATWIGHSGLHVEEM
jgi:Predicted membrane protein